MVIWESDESWESGESGKWPCQIRSDSIWDHKGIRYGLFVHVCQMWIMWIWEWLLGNQMNQLMIIRESWQSDNDYCLFINSNSFIILTLLTASRIVQSNPINPHFSQSPPTPIRRWWLTLPLPRPHCPIWWVTHPTPLPPTPRSHWLQRINGVHGRLFCLNGRSKRDSSKHD